MVCFEDWLCCFFSGSADFIGVNVYSASLCTDLTTSDDEVSFANDAAVECTKSNNGSRLENEINSLFSLIFTSFCL